MIRFHFFSTFNFNQQSEHQNRLITLCCRLNYIIHAHQYFNDQYIFYDGVLHKTSNRQAVRVLKLFMCQLLSTPAKIIDVPLYGDKPCFGKRQ